MPLAATISRFIEASNARNLDAAVACFAADAVVEDEGETHRGLAAVRAWKKATEDRFRYTIEPTGVERRSESETVVNATMAGDYPGIQVDLKEEFTLLDDAIEALRIHP